MALQKGGTATITAIMFTTNTALSSRIGLVYVDNRVRAGFALLIDRPPKEMPSPLALPR